MRLVQATLHSNLRTFSGHNHLLRSYSRGILAFPFGTHLPTRHSASVLYRLTSLHTPMARSTLCRSIELLTLLTIVSLLASSPLFAAFRLTGGAHRSPPFLVSIVLRCGRWRLFCTAVRTFMFRACSAAFANLILAPLRTCPHSFSGPLAPSLTHVVFGASANA